MCDAGNANAVDLGQSPGVSVLASTVGALLIIAPFVSLWRTGRRMEREQRVIGVRGGSGPLFLVLHLIPILSLFAPTYSQSELDRACRAIPDRPRSRRGR